MSWLKSRKTFKAEIAALAAAVMAEMVEMRDGAEVPPPYEGRLTDYLHDHVEQWVDDAFDEIHRDEKAKDQHLYEQKIGL